MTMRMHLKLARLPIHAAMLVLLAAGPWPRNVQAQAPGGDATGATPPTMLVRAPEPASAPARPLAYDCPATAPAYPAAAAHAGVEGRTTVRAVLNEAGPVGPVQIARRAGPTPEHALLDEAAQDWMGQCRVRAGQLRPGETSPVLLRNFDWRLAD